MFSYKKYSVIRDKNKMTDYEVSKMSGFPTATLSKRKAVIYTPKVDKIQKIAIVFNVSIEYFLE